MNILRLEVLDHQLSPVWACVNVCKDEILSICSEEKSEIGCKDLLEYIHQTHEGRYVRLLWYLPRPSDHLDHSDPF
ncbi:hypothetical protein TNCV_151301 [Trichonephila clavipes]|uniref:Uncharacterized protein n=1 Tax=Trichonephila clavipes TaxID=2585209 RepID=A0A8X6RJA6_TRICX|nr:hypothetical protein TNCV_151301 [Trichonephila clavipes]